MRSRSQSAPRIRGLYPVSGGGVAVESSSWTNVPNWLLPVAQSKAAMPRRGMAARMKGRSDGALVGLEFHTRNADDPVVEWRDRVATEGHHAVEHDPHQFGLPAHTGLREDRPQVGARRVAH